MRILFTVIFLLINSLAYAQSWREIKSDHFLLYFIPSPVIANSADTASVAEAEDFGKEVLRKAEVYYGRIAEDLGYQRSSEFWTWDKRAKIYLYPDHESFIKTSNHPAWAGGMADYDTKTIMSFLGSKDFSDTILPHEIAHLIFRDFVGFKGVIPLWLDEGVAQWTEEKKRQEVKKVVKEMLSKNGLLTMDDMMKLPINNIKSGENVYIRPTRTRSGEKGVLFLTGNNLITAYYVQAVSLVGFLIEKFGKNDFTSFCRALRDGKNLEEALVSVYSTHIRNLNDFDDQWKDYIENDT
jgi:hypothetical protein